MDLRPVRCYNFGVIGQGIFEKSERGKGRALALRNKRPYDLVGASVLTGPRAATGRPYVVLASSISFAFAEAAKAHSFRCSSSPQQSFRLCWGPRKATSCRARCPHRAVWVIGGGAPYNQDGQYFSSSSEESLDRAGEDTGPYGRLSFVGA